MSSRTTSMHARHHKCMHETLNFFTTSNQPIQDLALQIAKNTCRLILATMEHAHLCMK